MGCKIHFMVGLKIHLKGITYILKGYISHGDGSNEGSQHRFSLRNKKIYL